MAITAPTHADILPIGPSTDDPDNFDPEADAFVADLRPFGIQMNALSDNVYANALATKELADAADMSADDSAGSAAAALASKNAAAISEGHAHDSELAAANSAAQAANSSAGITASSATSLAVGAGAKVFAVPAGKQFLAGVPMVAVSASDPTKRMFGPLQGYSGTTLTLNITSFDGTGTANDWNISPSGAKGATGGTAGGQLTGALDELRGSDLVAASTVDPWSTGGNSMDLTGNGTINAIANAPQPGAKRSWLVTGAPTITNSANVIVKGGTVVLVPGDQVDIEAETISKFLLTVRRGDGTATTPSQFRVQEYYDSSVVYTAARSGPVRLTLKGACGAGAAVYTNNNNAIASAASGGAGGGLCIKNIYMNAGDTLVANLAASGAPAVASTIGAPVNGGAGGVSTVTGTNLSMTANGGQGGTAATRTTAGTVTAAGALGGTASGGDINITGGNSGTAVATVGASGRAMSASGGACCLYKSVVTKSGDATADGSNAGTAMAATGGAGVGGSSGAATSTITSSAFGQSATGGGGMMGGSAVVATTSTTQVAASSGGVGAPMALTQVPLSLNGAGTDGVNNVSVAALGIAPTGYGSGTGASTAASMNTGNSSGKVQVLGGSGAVIAYITSGNGPIASGDCLIGGGSGAAVGMSGASALSVQSGTPGKASLLIEHN
jgi:hypothetical protein